VTLGLKYSRTACTLPRWPRLVAEGIQRVRRHSDGAPIHNLLPLAAAVAAGVLCKHQLLLATAAHCGAWFPTSLNKVLHGLLAALQRTGSTNSLLSCSALLLSPGATAVLALLRTRRRQSPVSAVCTDVQHMWQACQCSETHLLKSPENMLLQCTRLICLRLSRARQTGPARCLLLQP